MTIFKSVTKGLARQLNPGGDLTPLDSPIDYKCFRPFCLVLRKNRQVWGARYVCTDYTLLDVLEPGSSPADLTDSGNFSFKNVLDAQVDGGVDVPSKAKVKGSAGLTQRSKLELKTLKVPRKALEKLQKERKLSADHPFLKEMQERGENLYVVMEVVETVKKVTLERAGRAKAILNLPTIVQLGLQGSMDQEVTIPEDCVLAYRVRQLRVNEKDEWHIPHICDDSMPTFPARPCSLRQYIETIPELPGGGKFIREMREDFQTLKDEVQWETHEVEKLSPVGRSSLLTSLSHLLGKKKELQDLEQKLAGALDKGHEVTLEALSKDVQLPKDSTPWGTVLYFLGALTVLSEAQQKLLVISLEKKILPVQLKLVESTLEQNFLQDKEGVFPLQPDLLSSLGEEELNITIALVGLSGLEVQRSGPQYTWDPDTLPDLCALYAGLSLLQLLSKGS